MRVLTGQRSVVPQFPVDWSLHRLKRICDLNRRRLNEDTDGDLEFDYVDISSVDAQGHIESGAPIRFADAPSRARRLVREGDTIISTVRTYLKAVALIDSDHADAVVSTGFAVLTPKEGVDPNFLSRYVQSEEFIGMVQAASVGIGYPSIRPTELADLPVPVPPLNTQRAIASFLDCEIEKTDTLIEKKRRLLNLLEEKRIAVITQAVTQGLDPNVPLKDSGVEWLGKIPEHWKATRLRHLTHEVTVGVVVEPSKYYENEGVPFLRSLNVWEMELTSKDLVFLSEESNLVLHKSRLRSGDLVAVRTGQPGKTAVVDAEFDGANCIDLLIIRQSPYFVSRYLGYFMNSDAAKSQYSMGEGGAIQKHFNVESAKDLVISVPPLEDQKAIVAFLDRETMAIRDLEDRIRYAISLLQEYRSALISAAVTGKIDVRDKVPG